jgi:hypothetical protein
MPSAGQISFVFDQTRMRWMTSLTSGRFQPPLSLTEGNTVDFVFRLSNNGVLFTPPLSPVWIFGIKDATTPNGDFLIQVNSATVASGVYTFVVELASAELQTWLATATSQSYAAIQITDSANDIATAPLLCQIEPNQNDSGTTPTSANGTLSVAAGKTVTFPLSLTFPAAAGTNGFQLSTDGAGTLTWTAAGGVTDGDKGDITVSASGATWTIDNDVVGLAQLAHMATARVVGRTTAGTGSPELLTISGTGSVAMTTNPQFTTPTLGAATGTSISLTGSLGAKDAQFQQSDTYDVISIIPRVGGINDYVLTLTNAPLTLGRTQTLPDVTGTVAVAATTTTATHALFATATAGAPAYRAIDGSDIAAGNIAVARIATALTTPGAIGGTTPGTVATTTTSLKGATSGVVTLAAPAVATTATLTFAPSASVTMTPPATSFTAARTDATAQTFSAAQTITGTTQNSLLVSATSASNASSPTNCVAVFQQGPGTGVGVFTDAAINLRATSSGAYVNAFIGSGGAGIIDISGNGSSSTLRVRDSNSPVAGTVGVSLTAAGNITAIGALAITGASTLTGAVTTANFIAGVEMTAPSAPAANGYRIYAEDNGSGKTRLMVLFATGVAQQIAIQP